MMPAMTTPADPARLPVLDATDDPRLEELFGKALRGPDGSVLNIFGTLGNHPDLLRRWLVFATHVLSKNSLPPRDRELLILRTGWNCRSRYEFAQHVLIAWDCGLSTEEIGRVRLGPEAEGWSPADRLLLRAADELHTEQSLSEVTWAELAATHSVEQLLDLVATVGNYHLVAMFLNSTRVELDGWVGEAVRAGGVDV
jgi:alkylhydroperoxidase family enzyme